MSGKLDCIGVVAFVNVNELLAKHWTAFPTVKSAVGATPTITNGIDTGIMVVLEQPLSFIPLTVT